jgi:circadian clock protein KaiC
MTYELPELFSVGRLSTSGLASLCDNVVLLQYTNDAARIRRTLTVLKTRGSEHDTRVREFRIDRRGVVLSGDDGEPPET